jgi:hypothetical protein
MGPPCQLAIQIVQALLDEEAARLEQRAPRCPGRRRGLELELRGQLTRPGGRLTRSEQSMKPDRVEPRAQTLVNRQSRHFPKSLCTQALIALLHRASPFEEGWSRW